MSVALSQSNPDLLRAALTFADPQLLEKALTKADPDLLATALQESQPENLIKALTTADGLLLSLALARSNNDLLRKDLFIDQSSYIVIIMYHRSRGRSSITTQDDLLATALADADPDLLETALTKVEETYENLYNINFLIKRPNLNCLR